MFLTHQCVDSKVFEKIADETNSDAVWDKLERYFGGNAKVKKVKLQAPRRQLELLQMKYDEKVGGYISRFSTLTNQMKQRGESLNEVKII